MHLNPHTIFPILCMMLAIVCGTFVILQNPKAKLNRIFLGICITFAAWFSFYIPYNFNYTDHLLITWMRISYCFISFIPITCFTFISTYLQAPKNEFWFKVNSAIGLSFAISSITTNWIIQGLCYYPWYPYPRGGILHPFLVLHCASLAYFSLKLMFNALRNPSLSHKQRNHLKYMISAILALSFGIVDFIGNYNVPIHEIGYIPASAYLIITTIAIIRHQLMDIQIVIRKSLVYSSLITLITLIFLTLVLIIEKLSQNYIGYQNILYSVILSIIVALIFIPLKNKIQTYVDTIFFKGTHFQIAEENIKLKEELTHSERMKAVAMIASGLAHEIKNPLTAIQTFTEYLPQKKNDHKFIDQYTRIVGQETQRINSLMQELLIFAKPSEPKFESINPDALIQNVINLLSPQLAKFNIKTSIELTNSPIQIQADPSLLKQALLNIIMNAIDSMPNGGELHVIPRSASQRSEPTRQSLAIEISDTGCGISPEDLKHIFEPFFTKKEKGTGLGLAITQGIIEKHGGTIKVESKIGQGTTFKITLPPNYAS